jgi:hypothetical protein
MVDPVVAIKTLLLREAMPDISLRPGASVVARVASLDLGSRPAMGVLVLAGVPLRAQLPDDVPAGATLRLKVAAVTPDRVTLQLDGPPQLAGAVPVPQPPPADVPPRVDVDDPPRRGSDGGEERSSVSLSFHSALLGRLGLRIEMTAGSVEVLVDAPSGAKDLVHERADALRDALAVRTGREATVRVRTRRAGVDVRA